MEYIVGKTAGFCYGVKNAVEKSEKALENEKPIYCLGEIVHNKNVVKDLENKGIIFIDDLKQNLEKRKTIIRAHGIAKEVYTQADKMGIDLIDLTCPKVLKIHKIVSEYNEKEYYIFLVGSKKHPEIIGTASFCGDDVSIIENIDDINISIDNFKKSNRKKLAIVVQTTFSLQKFTEITESIKKKFKNFVQKKRKSQKNGVYLKCLVLGTPSLSGMTLGKSGNTHRKEETLTCPFPRAFWTS